MTMARAEPQVVTVDERGVPTGTMPRDAAHRGPGVRHLAVSVMVRNSEGRLLLQRRAHQKALFAGLWSNTVCTHPLPGESPVDAASRRLAEELSIRCDLTPMGTFSYQASDPVSGLSENELDHVFLGCSDAAPTPDPEEVADVRWILPSELEAELERAPERFSPWLRGVLSAPGPAPDAATVEHLAVTTADTSRTEEPK